MQRFKSRALLELIFKLYFSFTLKEEDMFHQRKIQFGSGLMIVGSLLATIGEVVNIYAVDVLSSFWRPSLLFIVGGTFLLCIALPIFAAVSEEIDGWGFLGSLLLLLGGILLIVGTITLDFILLPFLTNLANLLAATVNGPATSAQDALNTVIKSINSLGGSFLQKLFPGSLSQIPEAHIPMVNGLDLVNKALVQLQLPTLETLSRWGHISLSGGTLTLGGLVLGVAIWREGGRFGSAGAVLALCALLNAGFQLIQTVPWWLGNGSAIAFFLTLIWLGVISFLRGEPGEVKEEVFLENDEIEQM
jgi:hypothetical protein